MQVQTFLGKVTIEGLHQLDQHINTWIKRHNVTPVHVLQSFGSEKHHDGRSSEPIIVTSIWYDESAEG